ncbi:MAG: hypothetical protein D3910_18775 [Candidatus Electrothrix sp. ATG2]|nr:hypothetical protein [Candidatus Electrothrix sp. ATG2]
MKKAGKTSLSRPKNFHFLLSRPSGAGEESVISEEQPGASFVLPEDPSRQPVSFLDAVRVNGDEK